MSGIPTTLWGGSRGGGGMDVPEAAAACSRVVGEVGRRGRGRPQVPRPRRISGVLARGHVLLEGRARHQEDSLRRDRSQPRSAPKVLAGQFTPDLLERRDRDQRVRQARQLLRLLARTGLRERRARRRINPRAAEDAGRPVGGDGGGTGDRRRETLISQIAFYVIATQNPVEARARSPLPEAQL